MVCFRYIAAVPIRRRLCTGVNLVICLPPSLSLSLSLSLSKFFCPSVECPIERLEQNRNVRNPAISDEYEHSVRNLKFKIQNELPLFSSSKFWTRPLILVGWRGFDGVGALMLISGVADAMHGFVAAVITAAIFGAIGAGCVAVPSTSCYVLDNTSHIHDFSNLVGQLFEYDDEKEPDLVIRFCKDIETRSQPGYVDFGRFDSLSYFTASAGYGNFVQGYYNGDLRNCERTYDKLGRTAQVNIICGSCPNGQCVGGLGCICSVTYESPCRVLIDLALPCMEPGLRVFEGFTVGFHPRSWEVVYNGLTQLGYEKAYDEFSFGTEQRDVTLYLTAVASLSKLVQEPSIKVSPKDGLNVQLAGSGANGSPPTTLSPTMLIVEWKCEKARDTPYEVEITIPVENYDPIQFTFAKLCEHIQDERGISMRGWAIFGIFSCVLIVGLTLSCVGVFIYRTRVQNLHGLDAIPGMAVLAACLETASGGGPRYTRPGDANDPYANQTTWEEQPTSNRGRATAASERPYGSI